jgi:glycosyltransferase involved in cell wall biosynthesis
MKKINIICPVYNEEKCIETFFDRIVDLKEKIKNYDIQLIFTNNCSIDDTYQIIYSISKKYDWVKIITFTRNFGYQASILAGLKEQAADLYFIVDVDLQDPPELLINFLQVYENENYEIVYGRRVDRDENFILKKVRKLYYRILFLIADEDFQIDMAEFFLITDKVKKNIINNKSTNIFLRNEVAYSGFARKGINFFRNKRISGVGKGESIIYMLKFGFAGFIAVSTAPLRLIFYLSFFIVILNLVFFLFKDVFSIFILLIFNFLYAVFSFSFLSIYIARIYKDTIARPIYIVDDKKTFL